MSDEVPAGLGVRGRRVWASLLVQDEALRDADNPTRELALEACRVADVLERYDTECAGAELTLMTDKGAVLSNPLFGERRQQQQNLKQLLVALRLPDVASGKRPQVRGARGAYQPSGSVAGGSVSSLDRARAKANGA